MPALLLSSSESLVVEVLGSTVTGEVVEVLGSTVIGDGSAVTGDGVSGACAEGGWTQCMAAEAGSAWGWCCGIGASGWGWSCGNGATGKMTGRVSGCKGCCWLGLRTSNVVARLGLMGGGCRKPAEEDEEPPVE